MARAIQKGTEFALIESGVVAVGNTIRQGMPVVFAAGFLVESVAQGTIAVGIAESIENQANTTTPWTAAAGTTVNFVRLGSNCIVKCRVGAGAATVNVSAVCAAAGAQDYAIAAGANAARILGTWAETGVVNDLRGLYVGDACVMVGA